MVSSAEDTYIMLDALDECHTRTGPRTEGLLSWIRDLLGSEHKNVHPIATNRPEQDIQPTLSELIAKSIEFLYRMTLPVMISMHIFALGLEREMV